MDTGASGILVSVTSEGDTSSSPDFHGSSGEGC